MSHRLCLDGPAFDSDSPFTRAGWVVVCLGPSSATISSLQRGPLPHPVQESGCGEVFALLMGLRSLEVGPVEIATDCQLGTDVWAKGPAQCLDDLAYSELWEQIFTLAEDYGYENITLLKVRSHLSLMKACESGIPIWAWRGNKEADRLA